MSGIQVQGVLLGAGIHLSIRKHFIRTFPAIEFLLEFKEARKHFSYKKNCTIIPIGHFSLDL